MTQYQAPDEQTQCDVISTPMSVLDSCVVLAMRNGMSTPAVRRDIRIELNRQKPLGAFFLAVRSAMFSA